ncbi:P-loop containing nucleoside triphosphate hydrolase protein [Cytidiella melzeri]|nr:P-loop containing nucleoside triphosphate hydrolase protein [Cytidiella melzeri]
MMRSAPLPTANKRSSTSKSVRRNALTTTQGPDSSVKDAEKPQTEGENLLPPACPKTKQHISSYQTLEEAREAATKDKDRRYSSFITQVRMESELSYRTGGMVPRWYQKDCAEAAFLGIDTGLICSTGSGKTEAFMLMLFADPTGKSKIIVISTLNALEVDQAARFSRRGIEAAAVNGETYSDELHKNVVATVIDEAHCVLEWGKEFRRDFGEVEKTRSLMTRKPIFFCTATLTPDMLRELLNKLAFSRERMFVLNLGNERHNITAVVCRLKSPSDYGALDFVLDEGLAGDELVPALIYVNTRELAIRIWLYLLRQIPRDSPLREQIDFVISTRDSVVKQLVIQLFMLGGIKIVIATESAGMGLDVPHLPRTIQFQATRSVVEWAQHAGRAGRNGMSAFSLMLVEPSVFEQTKKRQPQASQAKENTRAITTASVKEEDIDEAVPPRPKRKRQEDQAQGVEQVQHADQEDSNHVIANPANMPEDDLENDPDVEYRKKMEPTMREYIITESCRGAVMRQHFENPDPPLQGNKGHNFDCPINEHDVAILNLIRRLNARLTEVTILPPVGPDDFTQQQLLTEIPKRNRARAASVKTALLAFRDTYWRESDRQSGFLPATLLPDDVLATLASEAKIRTMDDLNLALPGWTFASELGPEKQVRYTIARS